MARSQEQHPQEVCGGVQLAIFSGTIVLRAGWALSKKKRFNGSPDKK